MKYLDIIREKRAKLAEERAALFAELEAIPEVALTEKRDLTDDESALADEVRGKIAALDEADDELAAREAELAAIAERQANVPPTMHVVRKTDPYDLDSLRFSPLDSPSVRHATMRDMALRAIESERSLDADQQAHAERLVRSMPEIAQRVLVTGNESYRQAWSALWDAAMHGRSPLLSPDQQRALERAASLTDAAGGYAVPFTLDPTVIVTQAQTTNPIRRIASVVSINTDKWNGISSGGITVSWDGEAAEVSDDSPTIAQPGIPVHKAQGFVPFSIEIGQDWPGFEAEMRREFQLAKDNAEASAFAVGTGTNQPTGIVTALVGGAQVVTSATTDTFAVADVYAVYEKPSEPWFSNGQFLANGLIYDKVRQFATANNYHAFWTDLGGGQPSQLLGQPANKSSAMDGTITALADNYVMVYGDFSAYKIVDRAGMSVELIPHLFATANNRPSGQRGLYCWWRVGGDSVNDAAFGLLNVT